MGSFVPQVVSEDRASGAQIVDGGLRFDSSRSHYLTRTPGSAGNRKIWTWSGWVKRSSSSAGGTHGLFLGGANPDRWTIQILEDVLYVGGSIGGVDKNISWAGLFRDFSAWYHIVVACDTTQSVSTDRFRVYVNGIEKTTYTNSTGIPTQNTDLAINNTVAHQIGNDNASSGRYFNGYLSEIHFIDGQALDPSYFGYTDPLTNVWRPKKLSSSIAFGTNGFYLPFDGSAPIGQDQSGRGNNWTPVNFGGSNTIEKATGALPILNTDGGGKVARVGVRTDAFASNLVLALPLVGNANDVSNQINSGSSTKSITVSGAVASSAQNVFYGGSYSFNGSSDLLSTPSSSDYNFGTGDYTAEGWVYITTTGDEYMMSMGTTVGLHWGLNFYSTNLIRAGRTDGSGNFKHEVTYNFTANRWYHLAVSRQSGTSRLFLDGVLIDSKSDTDDIAPNSILYFGRYYLTTIYLNGYLQDLRIYKGLAKYTSNFIPASTDPDIVPDSPSGVSYSSNLTQITDGAVAFDGSGDYLSIAASADFAFGTGDFTMECFTYLTSVSGVNVIVDGRGGSSSKLGPVIYGNGTSLVLDNGAGAVVTASSVLSTGIWYHIAGVRSGNTWSLYLNGIQQGSATDTSSYGSNTGFWIGNSWNSEFFDGFISNVHIVKGTALYTSNFTPPSAPISSVANTKLLCCKSNSSATAFDVSPGTITANGNAAATNFNPFTVDIDTQRGKQSGWCTLNAVDNNGGTLSDGNLKKTTTGATNVSGTIAMPYGKWYWEINVTRTVAGGVLGIGAGSAMAGTALSSLSKIYGYAPDGNKYANTSASSYGASYTAGDIIAVKFDADTRQLEFLKNNISQGVAFTVDSGFVYFPQLHLNNTDITINFGQKPFKFPPPAGFQPLTLANTPRPSIVRPDQYMGIVTWTGDGTNGSGTSNDRRVGGLSFKPDLVWCKIRTQSYTHVLWDSVRGAGVSKELQTSSTNAEGGASTNASGYISEFTSDGFNTTTGSSDNDYFDRLNDNYVAWCWKAGGNSNTFNIDDVGYDTAEAAGLTGGTITPTGASVNTKSGFSIITWTGDGVAGRTVSHGLGKSPSFIIIKQRIAGPGTDLYNWNSYHSALGATKFIALNTTSAASTGELFNNTAPTNTVFSLGGSTSNYYNVNNASNVTYVAYSWAEIPGFSKFGSYTGNGNADGPVVITGFRPRYILVKRTDTTSQWSIWDSVRDSYNPSGTNLWAESSEVEASSSSYYVDFLSNGFKLRNTHAARNASGGTYIYACWAEAPTFNLYGAQANAR